MTNSSGRRALRWEARFPGVYREATVDGAPARARTTEIDGVTYTVVERVVAPGRSVRVAVFR